MMFFKTLSVTSFMHDVASSLMLLIAVASAHVSILSIFATLSLTFGYAALLAGFCFFGVALHLSRFFFCPWCVIWHEEEVFSV